MLTTLLLTGSRLTITVGGNYKQMKVSGGKKNLLAHHTISY